jgi:hypothetical protein
MAGYVYLIGNPTFRWYKIGKSKTPELRIQNLGILLPFKIEVIGIWKAQNHSLMESTLHEQFKANRINGEWFYFPKKEVMALFESLPGSVRIFPAENSPDSIFKTFSNIDQDLRDGKKITHVRVQKLRGNFTPEEREEKRQAAVKLHVEKKARRLLEHK